MLVLGLFLNMDFGFDFGFGFDVCALWREKETSPFLYFYFYSFWFLDHVLEQATLTHDIERIFRSKKIQNDEGAKQHMAPPGGSTDITSSLGICEGGLIPRRHKERHMDLSTI